ncbi:MAG: hypothetical protein EZS28_056684, partial [Streblomastix strix]
NQILLQRILSSSYISLASLSLRLRQVQQEGAQIVWRKLLNLVLHSLSYLQNSLRLIKEKEFNGQIRIFGVSRLSRPIDVQFDLAPFIVECIMEMCHQFFDIYSHVVINQFVILSCEYVHLQHVVG